MKHIIDKSFSFCYGHRVWTQELNADYTDRGDISCKCKHLHGHEGLIKLYLEEVISGENIKKNGMVVDFKMTGFFKNFIDDYLDHKMILDENDPLLPYEVPQIWDKGLVKLNDEFLIRDNRGFSTVDLTKLVSKLDLDLSHSFDKALYEKYEGIVFVEFVPTSENLAAWLLAVAAEKMKSLDNVRVSAIEFNETPKSHCRVEAR